MRAPAADFLFEGLKNIMIACFWQLFPNVTLKLFSSATRHPHLAQLGANMASKRLQNHSENEVNMQLTEKSIFATPPMRNARFCFSKGVENPSKNACQSILK